MDTEAFKGFYKKSVKERQDIVAKEFNLTPEEKNTLTKEGPLPFSVADRMIENVIGTMPLAYGLATNFVIDGKNYIIPFYIKLKNIFFLIFIN